MPNALRDKKVVVVGRGSGIARAVALLARSEGAQVVAAGRDRVKLADAYRDSDIIAEAVDVTDDASIAALADRVGAVDHRVSTVSARARGRLAVELAPIRVNAVSPGVIDTGAWDSRGDDGKREYFEHIAGGNPVGRIGNPYDIAGAVLFAMTNTFLTGMTLKVDGGEPLI